MRSSIKNRLFVIAGTLFLGIGVIGIFIPILPTTPFLLLAAFYYLRGSRRLYDALLGNRFVGSYLKNYLQGRGMSWKMKVWTISLLWAVLISTIIFAVDGLVIRVILAIVLAGVTTHILLVKTLKR